MNKQSFLYHWKQKLESFIEIQELIATFNQLENPETSLISIIPEELFFGREPILNLLQIIISHANCQNINPFFQFFSDIKEHLVHHFSSEELFSIVEFNYIRLYLYEIGLITFESIISEAKTSFKIFRYFLIDIKENDETEFNHLIRIRFTTALNGVDIETFRENRKKMINENQIAKLIRFNNVNEFQNYLSSNNIPIDSNIPYSIFEICSNVNNEQDMPSLLEYSAYWGAIDIFKFLMMNGAKLGNKTVNYAILGGNLEILHLLEDANCSFDASLCAAIQDQRDDILDYIIDNKNISFDSDSVCSAIVNLNYRVISRVLDFLYDHPNDFDNDGITPLIYASINNNIMLVQLLLSIPSIDPNLPDSSNNNFPLLAAARCNSVDALQLLLKEPKIKINQINYLNHSAIMGGSIFGHLKIVEILGQQKSIDFNIFDHYQRNAFHLATVADRLDIVKYFMNSNKIQINVQDSFQNSHFIIAVEIENWKIVEYFLSVCKTCANIDSICSEIPSMEIKRKFQVLLLKYRNKLCQ